MADDRGPPALRLRCGGELPAVLPTRVVRAADVTQADGLRDDPAPRECRRVPALLVARDVARRVGGRSPPGARLLLFTPARGSDRVSVSGGHGVRGHFMPSTFVPSCMRGTYVAGVTAFVAGVAGPMPSSLRISRRLTTSTRTR